MCDFPKKKDNDLIIGLLNRNKSKIAILKENNKHEKSWGEKKFVL